MFSCEVYQIFKNWSLRTTAFEPCSFKIEVYERLLLKPVLSTEVSFLISYTSGLNWYIHFSFCIITYSFELLLTITDTAIIRSSRLVVFCKKVVLTNFAKFTEKCVQNTKSLVFNEVEKKDSGTCFLVNSAKSIITPFLKDLRS